MLKASRFPQISCNRAFFKNRNGTATSFQVIFFAEFFNDNDFLVILHKLAKYHYQTKLIKLFSKLYFSFQA